MKNCEQNSENSAIGNESEQDYIGQKKDEQIRQLLQTKSNFQHFLSTLGGGSRVGMSPATARYSREILPGYYGAEQINDLIEKRVDKYKQQNMKNVKKPPDQEKLVQGGLYYPGMDFGENYQWKAPQIARKNCNILLIVQKESYWETVAKLIPGVTAQDCMFKWLSMKKTKLSNNKWSEHESKILQKVTKQNGVTDWKNISRMVFLQNRADDKKYRSPKQCREQWNCYLNPAVKKGSWTVEEDLQLLKEVEIWGRRWSYICRQSINGRTQNAIKNRYNFLIQHRRGLYPDHDEESLLKISLKQLQEIRIQSQQNKKETDCSYEAVDNEAHAGVQKSPVAKLEPQQNQQPLAFSLCHPQPQITVKMEPQQYQKVTIIECNYEQIANFLRNNNILIPAKIQRNQLISYEGHEQKTMKVRYEGCDGYGRM